MDESSMDNNSLSINPPALSSLNVPTTTATATTTTISETPNILQSAIDKNILAEAQDIIMSLQFEGHYDNELANNNFKTEVKDDPDDDTVADDYDDFEDELASLIDGPILCEQEIAFNLQPPTVVPHYLNFHYICESGSRILFLSIFWIKKFRCFRLLR